MEKELLELPIRIENKKEEIRKAELDAEAYIQWKKDNPPATSASDKRKETEYRKNCRDIINKAIKDKFGVCKEKILLKYRGFDIILPANMSVFKPYVWICGNGRYFVEMGDTEIGNLIRIDNFLDELNQRAGKLTLALVKFENRKSEIKSELDRNENYKDQISKLQKKIKNLDIKLGVNEG